jgi:hypothetical protein
MAVRGEYSDHEILGRSTFLKMLVLNGSEPSVHIVSSERA